MGGLPDLPEQPRNSVFHARLWNRSSGGWASISTGRSDPPPNSATPAVSCSSFVVLLSMLHDSVPHFISFQRGKMPIPIFPSINKPMPSTPSLKKRKARTDLSNQVSAELEVCFVDFQGLDPVVESRRWNSKLSCRSGRS